MNVRENVIVIVNDDRDTNTNVETTAEFIYLNQRAKLCPDNPKPHQPLKHIVKGDQRVRLDGEQAHYLGSEVPQC